MSQTISVGVVGPSYWSYMSIAMAEYLDKKIQSKSIEGKDMPMGVFNEAQEFFRLVLQAAGDSLPDNPPASLNAYVIAIDAVKASSQSVFKTRQELAKCLTQYFEFIKRLSVPRELTSEEIEIGKALHKFFLRLYKKGEAEAYERGVYLGVPSFKFNS